MRENNKGSIIILTVIGIATLLIAVIGATFAFFSVNVQYEEKPTPTIIETSTMVIEFKTDNALNYVGAIPGRPSQATGAYADEAEKVDNKLQFTLTSDEYMSLETEYDVFLVIDENTFEQDNLVYMMNQIDRKPSSTAEQNTTAGKPGTEVIGVNTTDYIKYEDGTGESREVGIISKDLKKGDKLKIGTGLLGSHKTSDTWEFEVWLKETGEEQNKDQGKVLKAHIEVEPKGNNQATYEPDKIPTQ